MSKRAVAAGELDAVRSAATLDAAGETLALVVLADGGDQEALAALAARCEDEAVFLWVLSLLEKDDASARVVTGSLPVTVGMKAASRDRVEAYVRSPGPTTDSLTVRGALVRALPDEHKVAICRNLVADSSGLQESLIACAIECLAASRNAEARRVALLTGAAGGQSMELVALDALSRPLLAGEQADTVARLEAIVANPTADGEDPLRLARVLSRITPKSVAEVFRTTWNPQLFALTVSSGLLCSLLDGSDHLHKLLEYEMSDEVLSQIVSQSVGQLEEDRVLAFGKNVATSKPLQISKPILDHMVARAESDPDSARTLQMIVIGCDDQEVASFVGDKLSEQAFALVFESVEVDSGTEAFRVGLACGGFLDAGSAADSASRQEAILDLGIMEAVSGMGAEFWRGIVVTTSPDELSDSFLKYAVSEDDIVEFLLGEHVQLVLRSARLVEDSQRRLRVVELGSDYVDANDISELKPSWSEGDVYLRFWDVPVALGLHEVIAEELQHALTSRSGPQAASIGNEQLRRLLDCAIELEIREVPAGVESDVQRLLSDNDDSLVALACGWIGLLEDPSPDLIQAVVNADEARARPVTELGGLRQHLAQARLARVLDLNLAHRSRADALEDVKQLDKSIAWEAAVQLLDQDPMPPDEVRAAAAEVLATTEGDETRMPMVARFADREHIASIKEQLERAADGSGGSSVVLEDHRAVFISYVHEDSETVDRVTAAFDDAGITYWRDRQDLLPGSRWKAAIRSAVRDGSLFLACFSTASERKERSYMREEITIAIEQMRLRPTDRAWFIPAKLEECEIPDRDIGGGETLSDIQFISLFDEPDESLARLVSAVNAHQRRA